MPPITYQLFVSTLIQDAALKAVVIIGFVEVAPALLIVTPEPCTIEQVPLAPVFIIFIIEPVVKATELFGGMVIVVVPVLLYPINLLSASVSTKVSELVVTERIVKFAMLFIAAAVNTWPVVKVAIFLLVG